MPEMQNIRNDNAHEQGIRFLSLLNLMTLQKDKEKVLAAQNGRCNLCGAFLKESKAIHPHTFSKDRVTLEFDHRIPIDRGGSNDISNFQALCHYCNK